MLDIKSPTPPSVAFILAGFLIFWGLSRPNSWMVVAGVMFAVLGSMLQVLYLRFRYGSRKRELKLTV